jgi:hypothetical protein
LTSVVICVTIKKNKGAENKFNCKDNMKKTETFVGACSKYIEKQGWTTEIPISQIEDKGYIKLYCKVGQEVYKLCPKCNDRHNGSCKNCAWAGCFGAYCDIEPKIYRDGSGDGKKWQVVKKQVKETSLVHINENWNICYFDNEEKANISIKEFEEICKIEDREERYKAYLKWVKSRQQRTIFREELKYEN